MDSITDLKCHTPNVIARKFSGKASPTQATNIYYSHIANSPSHAQNVPMRRYSRAGIDRRVSERRESVISRDSVIYSGLVPDSNSRSAQILSKAVQEVTSVWSRIPETQSDTSVKKQEIRRGSMSCTLIPRTCLSDNNTDTSRGVTPELTAHGQTTDQIRKRSSCEEIIIAIESNESQDYEQNKRIRNKDKTKLQVGSNNFSSVRNKSKKNKRNLKQKRLKESSSLLENDLDSNVSLSLSIDKPPNDELRNSADQLVHEDTNDLQSMPRFNFNQWGDKEITSDWERTGEEGELTPEPASSECEDVNNGSVELFPRSIQQVGRPIKSSQVQLRPSLPFTAGVGVGAVT